MTLFFISIGLNDEKDMSIKALDVAKSCDKVFAEFYTSKLNADKEKWENFIEKELTILARKDLEEDHKKLLDEAKDKKVGLLIGGDALISTAHAALMIEARKEGIEIKVIHGSSIVSSVCESGLHIQKFGQMTTIPFTDRTKGNPPESVYNVILENKKRGLHTLCLLDMVAEENKFMKIDEALNILLDLDKEFDKNVINEDTEAVVFSRLGSDSQYIAYGKLGELINKDFGEPPYTLVLIGDLHFSEKEGLNSLK